MGIGRTILRLEVELVMSDYVEEEDIKEKEDLLASEGRRTGRCLKRTLG